MTREVVGYSITACVAVACRIYHIAWHPEWTEVQNLLALWPFYVAGAIVGFLVSASRKYDG